MASKPDYQYDKNLSLQDKGLYAILDKWHADRKNDNLPVSEVVKFAQGANAGNVRSAIERLQASGWLKPLEDENNVISIDGKLYRLGKQ